VLWALLSLLFLGSFLVRKARSQDNNAIINQSNNLELLKQSVIYKNPSAERIAYDIWRAEKLKGKWGGECVNFVEAFASLPENIIVGQAKNLETNLEKPQIGAIFEMKSGVDGHVGVVLNIRGDEMYIVDSNYGYDEIIQTRWMSINDPNIIGYWLGGDDI